MVIEVFVLAENDRIIQGNRFKEHAVSILYGRWGHNYQARVMGINGFHTLAVKRTATRGAAAGQAHCNRARHFGSPMERRGLVDNLIESDRREIRELHFDNRPHPLNGSADRQSNHRVLANGRIDYTSRELLRKVFGCLKGPAESTNVLAIDKDARILSECSSLCLANRVQIGDAHSDWASISSRLMSLAQMP